MWRKSTRRLYERETKDKKQTERPRTTSNRLKTRAKVVVDARRLLPSRNNTKNTHLFWSFFRRRPTRKEKEERPLKDVQKGTKKHSKKKEERGEKI